MLNNEGPGAIMEDMRVMKICELGLDGSGSKRCKVYYPVLTSREINEKIKEDADFNYIIYDIDTYEDEVHGDETLHWICEYCNDAKYDDA